jgi:simple sugar transport system ATP-binding protein
VTESASDKRLALHDVTKRFGSALALDGARFDVRPGTIHALLGENGAGKTTLMRIAFGMLQPDAGTLAMNGVTKHWRSSADAIAAGIGMVHQHFLVVPAMTVAENIALGDGGLFRAFDPRAAAERVRRIGADTGLMLDPSVRAGDLSVGAQQRLEIVKALAHDASVLILDEPTAVLSPAESTELYAWLRSFIARGNTVVLITHKVREALVLADDITVLRRGRTVLTGAAATLDETAIVAAMIGAGAPGN